MQAKISAMGLYKWDKTIFDDFKAPEVVQTEYDNLVNVIPFNTTNFVMRLLMETANLEILYPDPDVLKQMIELWSDMNHLNWSKLYTSVFYNYNPIWNKDSYIEHEENSGDEELVSSDYNKTGRETNSTSENLQTDNTVTNESANYVKERGLTDEVNGTTRQNTVNENTVTKENVTNTIVTTISGEDFTSLTGTATDTGSSTMNINEKQSETGSNENVESEHSFDRENLTGNTSVERTTDTDNTVSDEENNGKEIKENSRKDSESSLESVKDKSFTSAETAFFKISKVETETKSVSAVEREVAAISEENIIAETLTSVKNDRSDTVKSNENRETKDVTETTTFSSNGNSERIKGEEKETTGSGSTIKTGDVSKTFTGKKIESVSEDTDRYYAPSHDEIEYHGQNASEREHVTIKDVYAFNSENASTTEKLTLVDPVKNTRFSTVGNGDHEQIDKAVTTTTLYDPDRPVVETETYNSVQDMNSSIERNYNKENETVVDGKQEDNQRNETDTIVITFNENGTVINVENIENSKSGKESKNGNSNRNIDKADNMESSINIRETNENSKTIENAESEKMNSSESGNETVTNNVNENNYRVENKVTVNKEILTENGEETKVTENDHELNKTLTGTNVKNGEIERDETGSTSLRKTNNEDVIKKIDNNENRESVEYRSGEVNRELRESGSDNESNHGEHQLDRDETLTNVQSGKTLNVKSGSGSIDNEENGNENRTSNRNSWHKEIHKERGNIGVTSTQQLIESEREIAVFNIYDIIIASFKENFCLLVY